MTFNLTQHIQDRSGDSYSWLYSTMTRLGAPTPANDNSKPVAYGPHKPWWV